ncbi:uncharacterized protein JN550_008605 [Neoarthrinium moseri]|uniref:uncharacterized protein n=1 Tax=Neoarthrinium moseri TaxID=1658444 RepID=UPI001FDAF6DD|nr:uncharacterized protein JN550_008605 [Neoarthrinium moseri]KAI1865059.1 hypothetical protein JN550_008605 [Neoarthrinium moseri]
MSSSSTHNIDFTQLPDLRSIYPTGGQNGALSSQHIATYQPRSAAGLPVGLRDMHGVDVVVTLLRHLSSMLAPWTRAPWRRDGEEFTNEDRFPILRLAWSDLSRTLESMAAQDEARRAIVTHLGIMDRPVTFLDIMDCPLMYEALMQTKAYQLYSSLIVSQPLEESLNGKWDIDGTGASRLDLARRCVVHWDCQDDLDTHVSKKFGFFEHRGNGRRYLYQFNQPGILQVRFRSLVASRAERQQLHGFRKIWKITVDGSTICQVDENGHYCTEANPRYDYVLVAVVRLRDGAIPNDVIRRYSANGDHVHEPSDFLHAGTHRWSVADENTSFVLFYARCIQSPPPLHYPAEVTNSRLDAEMSYAKQRRFGAP